MTTGVIHGLAASGSCISAIPVGIVRSKTLSAGARLTVVRRGDTWSERNPRLRPTPPAGWWAHVVGAPRVHPHEH